MHESVQSMAPALERVTFDAHVGHLSMCCYALQTGAAIEAACVVSRPPAVAAERGPGGGLGRRLTARELTGATGAEGHFGGEGGGEGGKCGGSGEGGKR